MILLVVTHAAYGRHLLFSLKKPTANSWAFLPPQRGKIWSQKWQHPVRKWKLIMKHYHSYQRGSWKNDICDILHYMYACLSIYMYVIFRFQHMASSKRSHFGRPDHTISYFTSVTVILQEFCIVCDYHMLVHAPQVLSKAPSQTTTKHAKTHIKSANDADSSQHWVIKLRM